MIFSVVL